MMSLWYSTILILSFLSSCSPLRAGSRIASTLITSALSFQTPIGDIGAAVDAIVRSNGEAISCVLDTRKADENHDSCQLKDDVVRWRAGKLMVFKQDWGRSKSTGAAIWNGANMAGWYLENILGSNSLKNKRVIELGAGIGFTSIIAKQLGAAEVVITDGDEDVLKIADTAIELNFPFKDGIKTGQLRWNTEDEKVFTSANGERPWDYIIVADCTYKKNAWPDLVSSISHLSGPDTITLVSGEPRSVGETEGFLAEVEKQGLQWREEHLPIDPITDQCNLQCPRLFAITKKV